MEAIIPGKYKHYKGKIYEVLGEAIHSETDEKMVVYKMLYSTTDHPKETLWVRPKAMFLEQVTINGTSLPRFEKVK